MNVKKKILGLSYTVNKDRNATQWRHLSDLIAFDRMSHF